MLGGEGTTRGRYREGAIRTGVRHAAAAAADGCVRHSDVGGGRATRGMLHCGAQGVGWGLGKQSKAAWRVAKAIWQTQRAAEGNRAVPTRGQGVAIPL